ncbi:methionine adenosyltransferase [Patescibacteria group bacterium]|nr:methionine adenosyltransferase [Patescibacteria group bacterium]MBU1721484.1 methionine adenosyltransferase [Patescibacteria group bacterium]
MENKYFFTSESVSEGHPDKVADQISDAILDECLIQDPKSRVACETLVTTGLVVVAGEISTNAYVDMNKIARGVIADIGYTKGEYRFDAHSCGVMVSIDEQSPDIAQGVNEGEGLDLEQGAGDQGLMFGYATDETPELMPATAVYSHKLLQELARVRHAGEVAWLRPDSKSQVTAEYEGDVLNRIDTIVISTQHDDNISLEDIREFVIEQVIKKVIPAELLDENTVYHVNPTGKFILGGPHADTGLTGRKIIVDTYGGHGRHGGGAFSGKDPSKVDRSAAYYARYMAKHVVAAGAAKKCEVQLSYAIGVAKPVSVHVNTFGTGDDRAIEKALLTVFDARPAQMVQELDLLQPIYRKTAAYGHFGRDEFPWEKLSRLEELKTALSV